MKAEVLGTLYLRQGRMYADSCEVLQTEYLLGEILKRSRSSIDLLRASHVSNLWQTTARIPTIVSGFTDRNRIRFIGFIVEHGCAAGPGLRLISPPIASDDDSTQKLRERFVFDGLYGKHILGTHAGCVICRVESGSRKDKLFISCPYSSNPRSFRKVGRPILPMEKSLGDNTYGRFAVLEPTAGPVGGYPVFFIKDHSRDYRANHLGVYFDTPGRVRVHVCVFSDGEWVPYASDPLALPSTGMFQRSPYCVQAGCRLYLMYALALIVCFDAKEKTFGVMHLPGKMGTTVKGFHCWI